MPLHTASALVVAFVFAGASLLGLTHRQSTDTGTGAFGAAPVQVGHVYRARQARVQGTLRRVACAGAPSATGCYELANSR